MGGGGPQPTTGGAQLPSVSRRLNSAGRAQLEQAHAGHGKLVWLLQARLAVCAPSLAQPIPYGKSIVQHMYVVWPRAGIQLMDRDEYPLEVLGSIFNGFG